MSKTITPDTYALMIMELMTKEQSGIEFWRESMIERVIRVTDKILSLSGLTVASPVKEVKPMSEGEFNEIGEETRFQTEGSTRWKTLTQVLKERGLIHE